MLLHVLCCLLQLSSIGLCPNTIGQVVVSVLCNPPKPGDPSYATWQQERSDELASLARRADLVSSAFNGLPNMTVVPTEAAMYSFPQASDTNDCGAALPLGRRNICWPVDDVSAAAAAAAVCTAPLYISGKMQDNSCNSVAALLPGVVLKTYQLCLSGIATEQQSQRQ